MTEKEGEIIKEIKILLQKLEGESTIKTEEVNDPKFEKGRPNERPS